MSDVSVWSFFAYMTDDGEGSRDEHRRAAEWQVQDVVRWAMARGYDNIYLSRDPTAKTRFEPGPAAPVRHHMHLIEGSQSEQQGDDAA